MSRKSGLFRSGILLSALLVLGCEQGPQQQDVAVTPGSTAIPEQSSECVLVMGWDPWEPYQFLDSGGEVNGLDVEIARAAAEAGNCSIELVQSSWMELLTLLQAGDVDLLAGATRTPGRSPRRGTTSCWRSRSRPRSPIASR